MSKVDKHESESRKKRRRSRSNSRGKSPHRKDTKKPKERKRTATEDGEDERQSGSSESLSIAETNKLRAKLGLAPLDVTPDQHVTGGDDQSKPRNSDTDFVHAPAKNLTEAKKTETIQEKISIAKEKRELMDKLREVSSLGSGNDLSASSWIDKMRAKEKAKREADEREKMLSEMDEEFGVSEVVSSRLRDTYLSKNDYSSSDLQGLKVEHKVDRFENETPIILTLKDKGILEEDDSDVLVNVNIIDDEKAEKNRMNKRNVAGLGGIAVDEDEDVLLGLRMKGVLEKYDAEIDGDKTQNFVLTQGGSYSADEEVAMRRLREELQQGRQSLEGQEVRVASEFYSVSEMDQFKKRKRKVKMQKRTLRADDLMTSMAPDQTMLSTGNINEVAGLSRSRDHGTRRRGGKSTRNEDEPEEGEVDDSSKTAASKEASFKKPAVPQNGASNGSGLNPAIAALLQVQTIEEEDDNDVNDDAWANDPLEPDDLQFELEKTLERVRRTNLAKSVPQEMSTLRVIKSEPVVLPKMEANSEGNGLVFDSTAEFFKQITGGLQTANQDRYNQSMVIRKEEGKNENEKNRSSKNTKAEDEKYGRPMREKSPHESRNSRKSNSINNVSSSRHTKKDLPKMTSGKEESNELRGVLDDEPELDQGLFSALRLALKKGYVDEHKEVDRPVGRLVNLMAKNCVKEEIRYDDIKAKFTERYQGPLSEFREKPSYKPEVKLHYVDDLGRNMTPKEAFRQLSHKFHGKGSGKKKIEKRNKKIMEEVLLKSSASSDTPLGTVNKLNKKLERQGAPYVVLSGKNAVSKNLMK